MKQVIVSLSKLKKAKTKMAQFLKFKSLITLKLNFNGGQFYKKICSMY